MAGRFDIPLDKKGLPKTGEMAKLCKISPQAVANWKFRKAIPWVALYRFSRTKNISFDELLTGEEPALPPDYVEAVKWKDKYHNALEKIVELREELDRHKKPWDGKERRVFNVPPPRRAG